MKQLPQHSEARRAIITSAVCVLAVVAVEYLAIVAAGTDTVVSPQQSHVFNFRVGQNGTTAAFVILGYSAERDPMAARDQLGCIDPRHIWPPETLWKLSSRPHVALPCDQRQSLIVACTDGSIVEVTPPDHGNCEVRSVNSRLIGYTGNTASYDLAYDGQHDAVIARGRQLCALDLGTGQEKWILDLPGVHTMALDNANSCLYCGLQSGEIIRVSTATGHVTHRKTELHADVVHIEISPCGQYLATLDSAGALRFIRLKDDQTLWSGQANGWVGAAFSRDGSYLIVTGFGDEAGRLCALDCKSGQLSHVLGEHPGLDGIHCMADGRICSWDSRGCILSWSQGSPSRPRISRRGSGCNWLFTLASTRQLNL